MRRNLTRAIAISADYETVFAFLIDVESMPIWTIFVKKVWTEGEKFIGETYAGEAELWIEHNRDRGQIIFFWKVGDVEDSAPTCLIEKDGQLIYEFTIQEPLNAPEGTLDGLVKIVDEELIQLKTIAEKEFK